MLWAWVGEDREVEEGTPGGNHPVSRSLEVGMTLTGCEEREYILTPCLNFLNNPMHILEETVQEHLGLLSRLERQNVGNRRTQWGNCGQKGTAQL